MYHFNCWAPCIVRLFQQCTHWIRTRSYIFLQLIPMTIVHSPMKWSSQINVLHNKGYTLSIYLLELIDDMLCTSLYSSHMQLLCIADSYIWTSRCQYNKPSPAAVRRHETSSNGSTGLFFCVFLDVFRHCVYRVVSVSRCRSSNQESNTANTILCSTEQDHVYNVVTAAAPDTQSVHIHDTFTFSSHVHLFRNAIIINIAICLSVWAN